MKPKTGSHNRDEDPNNSLQTSTFLTNRAPPSTKTKLTGIYDLSQMKSLVVPTDPHGITVLKSSKNGSQNRNGRKSEWAEYARAILLAVSIPLIVIVGALSFREQILNLTAIGSLPTREFILHQNSNNRAPAALALLPDGKSSSGFIETQSEILTLSMRPSEIDLFQVLLVQPKRASVIVTKPNQQARFKLELDDNGQLVSPFSIELDEYGNPISHQERSSHLLFLPPIEFGSFQNASSFSELQPSEEFTRILNASKVYPRSVFKFSLEETQRFNSLKNSVREISGLINVYSGVTRSLIGRRPIAAKSLTASSMTTDDYKLVNSELNWIEPTLTISQFTGDRAYDERLRAAMLEWAQAYSPSGNIADDARVGIAVATIYDYLAETLKEDEIKTVRDFLLKVADVQLLKFKGHRAHDRAHAQHVFLMTSLGGVLGHPAILEHAIFQYRKHVEQSPLFLAETYGYDQLRSLGFLLDTTFLLERMGFRFYQEQIAPRSLASAIEALKRSSHIEFPSEYLETATSAFYFDDSLAKTLRMISKSPNNRFATSRGIILAVLKNESSGLLPSKERLPSSHPSGSSSSYPYRPQPIRGR
jgi:hypothetical protein